MPSQGSESAGSLPFGKQTSLASISGPTYVTAQLLVQQIAYQLSDKIFAYSPESFDLDAAAKNWAATGEKNIHGYPTTVLPMQTRSGAGALALGYIFSSDFDLSKRHIPQTLLAPTGSLHQLRASLDQLSLLHDISSPFVGHIAAVDYTANDGLVSNYDSAMRLAEDIGLGLVSSTSTYEAQHMSVFSTLLASILPTLHIYDGIRMARETLRVVDALSEKGVKDLYSHLAAEVSTLNPRLDSSGKVLEMLRLFNDELGTIYEAFEYHGHKNPDVVLVTFGSTESSITRQVISKLANEDAKVAVINVRVYRPFIEEAFLAAVPASTRTLVVLGQVSDEVAVEDEATQSALYGDVLTAVTFTGKFASEPRVIDVKYTPFQIPTPQGIVNTLHKIFGNADAAKELPSLIKARQYTFWDLDDSATLSSPSAIGSVLSKEHTSNVFVHKTHDNLTLGGIARTDVRSAKKALDAPYSIEQADVVMVGDEKILTAIDVLKNVSDGGELIVKLNDFKEEDMDKRLPAPVRKAIHKKGLDLFILDLSASPALEKDPAAAKLLLELSFLRVARPELNPAHISELALPDGQVPTLQDGLDTVEQCLRKIEVPAAWREIDAPESELPSTIQTNSFAPYQRTDEAENPQDPADWQVAAAGLLFKEAYGTRTALRPELPVKTATITVKENRRLTPAEYDRNIFHIEFDLGDSGLTYKIGEALGIHAENDEEEVNEFIRFYGLRPEELAQVPAREDNDALEVRTIYQALSQNLDILGKPPKRFYEALAEFAGDEKEREALKALASPAGAEEFKKRSELDTVTYVDILQEFQSAHPSFNDLVKIISPLKRREYSIASAQAVTPTSVALMIVVVDWVDPKGRNRFGHATRYLSRLQPGAKITASVKPSVMKLPTRDTAPLIMAGLGTGLAPFRAFVQYRAMQKAQGKEIGSILLYLGSRHQREEYLYGEEWEAYRAAGVVTLIGSAFSRDQPQKIYIQDRMRQTIPEIIQAYIKDEGSFYLCGPTWPVPDVTAVLEEAITANSKALSKKVDSRKEIEKLKEEGRYVLEVY